MVSLRCSRSRLQRKLTKTNQNLRKQGKGRVQSERSVSCNLRGLGVLTSGDIPAGRGGKRSFKEEKENIAPAVFSASVRFCIRHDLFRGLAAVITVTRPVIACIRWNMRMHAFFGSARIHSDCAVLSCTSPALYLQAT